MKKNKPFILCLITKDEFLAKSISETFAEKGNLDIVVNPKKIVADCIVFDDISQENLLKKYLKSKPEASLIKVQRPIKINELLSEIEQAIRANLNQISIDFADYSIDTQKRGIVKNGKILENLTEKETDIIIYLYKNPSVDKQNLLDNVWHYKESTNTKVVESSVYKLRQKFKKHNLQSPILFVDGNYGLNV